MELASSPVSVQTERIDDTVIMHVNSPQGSVDIGFPLSVAKLVARQLADCADQPGRRDAFMQIDPVAMHGTPPGLGG